MAATKALSLSSGSSSLGYVKKQPELRKRLRLPARPQWSVHHSRLLPLLLIETEK